MFSKFYHIASTIKKGKPVAGKVEGVKTVKSEVTSTRSTFSSVNTCNGENKHKIHTSMSLALATDLCEEKIEVLPLEGVTTSTIVETVILTGLHQGVWIKAKVLRMKENTVDIKVLRPRKWSVVGVAVDVPNQYIRPVSHSKSYTIPVKFMLDNSVLYVASNKLMKVEDLKRTIHRVRIYPMDQIYFLHNGKWLQSYDPVPDDVIFCIIHRGDQSNSNLNVMVSKVKKQLLLHSAARTESDISSLEGAYSRSRSYSTSYTNEDY